jgi:magnesium transporter
MLNSYPPEARAVWIDLVSPTPDEVSRVEHEYGLHVPTRAQLDEIESSSRLRVDGKQLYLSMPLSAQQPGVQSEVAPVGFVVSPELLVTVRYADLAAFARVGHRVGADNRCLNSIAVFASLLEEMIDVGADLLERVAANLGGISRQIFRRGDPRTSGGKKLTRMLRETLINVGDTGEHLSQIRESVTALLRINGFVAETGKDWLDHDIQVRLKTMRRDLTSLADFESHLSGKVQFLLDATLGFINTEQNDIFKVLTIASVVGIPPTLIASLYGMNFHNMPELDWKYGYPYGLTLIVLSTLAPILWFKWRGWW